MHTMPPSPKIEELLVIDTETNGLDPEKGCRVIEVACATLRLRDWQIIKPWSALIVGGDKIQGEYHEKAGTFAGTDWSQAWAREHAMRDLFGRMEGAYICGQNVGFDLNFLRAEAKQMGMMFPRIKYHVIDTVPMCAPLLVTGRLQSLSLEVTRKWAGCEGKQAHRALGDVMDTIAVFRRLVDVFQLGVETLEAMER